jgi:hypothetical protein
VSIHLGRCIRVSSNGVRAQGSGFRLSTLRVNLRPRLNSDSRSSALRSCPKCFPSSIVDHNRRRNKELRWPVTKKRRNGLSIARMFGLTYPLTTAILGSHSRCPVSLRNSVHNHPTYPFIRRIHHRDVSSSSPKRCTPTRRRHITRPKGRVCAGLILERDQRFQYGTQTLLSAMKDSGYAFQSFDIALVVTGMHNPFPRLPSPTT